MHDPHTVAFALRGWVTIWHHDPESDGSDDSCGWSYPNLTEAQREKLKALAWPEAYEPWFQKLRAKTIRNPILAESLMRAATAMVCRVLGVKADWGEICLWSARFVHNPIDNFRGALCHLPGYHTNSEKDTRHGRENTAYGLFSGIACHVLRERRPWWRHPKWHVWHWQFQVHPLQRFRRWLLTRCQYCGGRFRWNESVMGLYWDAPPQRWLESFRGERGIIHHRCRDALRGHVEPSVAPSSDVHSQSTGGG